MIRNWLRNFMVGRYGPDQLNTALVAVAFVFYILNAVLGVWWLMLPAYLALFAGIYRMMSHQIEKRRRENDRFVSWWWPIKRKVTGFIEKTKQKKNYRFFKCPACKNVLRVPKGKGKIEITCPKCGERFRKKT